MKILCMLPAAKGVYPEEAAQRRINVVKSYSTATTQIDVDYMPAVSGFVPWGGREAPVQLARAHLLSAERALQAEKEGYDAFIPFGMLDIGVELARNLVNIPVIGQAQATFAIARTMVNRTAAIWYQSRSFSHGWRQLKAYGAEDLVQEFYAVEMPNSEMPQRRNELKERFVSLGKQAVAKGAELIICHGMSMCPIEFPAKELAEGIGVPVLEGMGCAVAMAEAWHRLGTPYSHVRYPHSGE